MTSNNMLYLSIYRDQNIRLAAGTSDRDLNSYPHFEQII
jgi:hypothetical protein